MFDPADFAQAPQAVRCFLRCRKAAEKAWLRIWVEPLAAASISDVAYGRVAGWPDGERSGGPYRLAADLPDGQREVVVLRFADGFSLEEIAEALSIPLGTVKSRLFNALKALRASTE